MINDICFHCQDLGLATDESVTCEDCEFAITASPIMKGEDTYEDN